MLAYAFSAMARAHFSFRSFSVASWLTWMKKLNETATKMMSGAYLGWWMGGGKWWRVVGGGWKVVSGEGSRFRHGHGSRSSTEQCGAATEQCGAVAAARNSSSSGGGEQQRCALKPMRRRMGGLQFGNVALVRLHLRVRELRHTHIDAHAE